MEADVPWYCGHLTYLTLREARRKTRTRKAASRLLCLAACVVPLWTAPALAGDYEEGNKRVRAGELSNAARLYSRAAAQGHPGAQAMLGTMYRDGQGIPKDSRLALMWYGKAAAQGDAFAQLNLGLMYFLGNGVAQDYREAMTWYVRAADQNLSNAQLKVGLMYLAGNGVARDAIQGILWIERAANQGDVEAQTGLGLIYAKGEPALPKDDAKAVGWFRKAAEQGSVASQYQLGLAFAQGAGVAQDYVQAHKWFNLAAATGDSNSTKARTLAASLMTREQVAEAQQLAREWSSAHSK
jgi:TPR repeat protein